MEAHDNCFGGTNIIMDEAMRDMLQWMKSEGHLNHTAIVMISDHGPWKVRVLPRVWVRVWLWCPVTPIFSISSARSHYSGLSPPPPHMPPPLPPSIFTQGKYYRSFMAGRQEHHLPMLNVILPKWYAKV